MTNLQKIAKWFANRKNEYATFAEICKAFPEIKPKTISSVLSKKTKDSNGDLRYMFPVKGTRGHYKYFLNPLFPIYSEVKNLSDPEEVEIEKMPADEFFANVDRACKGDCSHCTADTCISKDETLEDEAETLEDKEKPEAETLEDKEKPEAETLDSILEMLRSIDKHLAQIAEVEYSVAKLFLLVERRKGI